MPISFQTDTNFLDHIKPTVRRMSAYKVEGGQDAEVKLNQNENPYDLPEWLKREIAEAFVKESWNRYPSVSRCGCGALCRVYPCPQRVCHHGQWF